MCLNWLLQIWLIDDKGTESLVSDGLSEYLSPGDDATEGANVLFTAYGAAADVTVFLQLETTDKNSKKHIFRVI